MDLDGKDVGAALQDTDEGGQVDGLRCTGLVVGGRGVLVLARRHAAAGNFRTVDERHEPVVVVHGEAKPPDRRGVPHSEVPAHVEGEVVVPHVAQHRIVIAVAVADAGGTGEPR